MKTDTLFEREKAVAGKIDYLQTKVKVLQDRKESSLMDLERRTDAVLADFANTKRGRPDQEAQEKILREAGASESVAHKIVDQAIYWRFGSIDFALADAADGLLGEEAAQFTKGLSPERLKVLKQAAYDATIPPDEGVLFYAQACRDERLERIEKEKAMTKEILDEYIAEAQRELDARRDGVIAMREEVFAELERLAQQLGTRAERTSESSVNIEWMGQFIWRADRGWGKERVVRHEDDNNAGDLIDPSYWEERNWYAALTVCSKAIEIELERRRTGSVGEVEDELQPVVNEVIAELMLCEKTADYYYEEWVYNRARSYQRYTRNDVKNAVIHAGGKALKDKWLEAVSRYIKGEWENVQFHRSYGWIRDPYKPGKDSEVLPLWEECKSSVAKALKELRKNKKKLYYR